MGCGLFGTKPGAQIIEACSDSSYVRVRSLSGFTRWRSCDTSHRSHMTWPALKTTTTTTKIMTFCSMCQLWLWVYGSLFPYKHSAVRIKFCHAVLDTRWGDSWPHASHWRYWEVLCMRYVSRIEKSMSECWRSDLWALHCKPQDNAVIISKETRLRKWHLWLL